VAAADQVNRSPVEQADRVLLFFGTRTHFLPRQVPQDHQQLQSPVDLEFTNLLALEV
jgi:hypothetical protein